MENPGADLEDEFTMPLVQDFTIPPVKASRFDNPTELFRQIPQVSEFMKHRPQPDEGNFEFLQRQKTSTTPEDAIIFAAFAVQPIAAISWALQCMKSIHQDPKPEDMHLVSLIIQWINHQGDENRWQILQASMFARHRSAFVYLGLAVGWSGGVLAPNDPCTPPAWRAPRAVGAAILRSIAEAGFEKRSINLARSIDLAVNMLRPPYLSAPGS